MKPKELRCERRVQRPDGSKLLCRKKASYHRYSGEFHSMVLPLCDVCADMLRVIGWTVERVELKDGEYVEV